jgi:uncharacterized glyoxalase superfamily protein PhnB
MDIKLKSSIILTRNMRDLVDFYVDVLELEIIKQYDTVTFFKHGPEIHDADTYFNYINKDEVSKIESNLVLYFIVSDIEAVSQMLKEKQCDLIHDIQLQSWGEKCIRMYDPVGNVIEFGDGQHIEGF